MRPILTFFYSIDDGSNLHNSNDILAYAGNNTGNLLFRNALQNCIVDTSQYEVIYIKATQNIFLLNEVDNKTATKILNSSLVIYPIANILRDSSIFEVNTDIKNETSFLSTLTKCFKCPILIMGLGAQTKLDNSSSSFSLHNEQQKLIENLLKSTGFVTVRGKITQQICNFDLHSSLNAQIIAIGCPSLMTTISPMKPYEISPILNKIAICLPNNSHYPICKLMVQYAENDSRVNVIMQDATDIKNCSNIPPSRKHIFSSIESWNSFLKTCDFCLSARIHGNQMCILAETPSILIATDSRIKELAESMSIPYIATPPELLNKKGPIGKYTRYIDNIINNIDSTLLPNYINYNSNKKNIASKYIELLKRINVPPHPNIYTIANSEEALTPISPKTIHNEMSHLDTNAYCDKYPDPFLLTQNKLGLVFHICTTNNEFKLLKT